MFVHAHHAYTDEPGHASFNADLTDYYPSPVQPSVNGAGTPAAPGSVKRVGGSPSGGVGAPVHHSPALVVLALAVVSLALLHHAG